MSDSLDPRSKWPEVEWEPDWPQFTTAELDAAYEKAMSQLGRVCKRGHLFHAPNALYCHACGAKLEEDAI